MLDQQSSKEIKKSALFTEKILSVTNTSETYLKDFAPFYRECLRISYYNIRVKFKTEQKNKYLQYPLRFSLLVNVD